jgi:uncharacterized protein (DUF1919 family)
MPTNFGADVVTGDVILPGHVNVLRSAVNTLENGGTFYAPDTGTANAYVITLNPAPTSPPPNGFIVRFKATNANTGPSTLNVNGQGAVSITRRDGGPLVAGDIKVGQVVEVVRNGSVWQLISQDVPNLDSLSDVNVPMPVDKQVLAFDSASSQWKNQNVPLGTLGDVNVTAPGDKQVLAYDTASSKWKNQNVPLDSLSDVTAPTPVDKQVLAYDGATSSWKNQNVPLDSLGDVTVTTPADNQVLAFDAPSGQWKNQNVPLGTMEDVTVSLPADKQVLAYDAISSKWKNQNVPLDSLSDVTAPTPVDKQVLAYDSATSSWKNQNVPLDSLSDVTAPTPVDKQVLAYDSATSSWKNQNVPLDSLGDVTVTTPTNNQVLAYDSASSQWKNANVPLGTLSDVTVSSPVDNQVLAYDSASSKWMNQAAEDAGLAALTALLPGFVNLLIQNNGATPASKVDVTADAALLLDGSNNGKLFRTVSVTVNIAVSGAGGLDTGTEAANTTYFIWLIGKSDGTIAGLFSTSATAPTMPSGYTYRKLVGFVRNDGGSNFLGFYQRDRILKYDARGQVTVFNGLGVPTSATNLGLASFVPPAISRMAILNCQINGASNLFLLRGDSTTTTDASAYLESPGGNTAAEFLVGTDSSGNIKYYRTGPDVTMIIRAIGCFLRI